MNSDRFAASSLKQRSFVTLLGLGAGVQHVDEAGGRQQFHRIREGVQPVRQRNGGPGARHRRPTERSERRTPARPDERRPHHPRTVHADAAHRFQGETWLFHLRHWFPTYNLT